MLSRRTLLPALAAGFGATAGTPALPNPASPAVRRPPRLKPGDVVGVAAPASPLDDPYDLRFIVETVTAMGLTPRLGKAVAERTAFLAGEDHARAADIDAFYADPEVKAVFAMKGGWGSARLLPLLNWPVIRANPKLLVGFSDVTALHMAIAAMAGFTTIHGPLLSSDWGARSWAMFRSLCFDGATPVLENPASSEDRLAPRAFRTRVIRSGRAAGPLLGGNLTVLTALLGSPYLPAFDGAILFLEETGEAEYRIDRMLTSLRLAGVLDRVAGVVFGQCTECRARDGAPSGVSVSEILQQHIAPLGAPAYQGALIGHIHDQFSLPIGVKAEIDADAGVIRLLEPAVA